MVIFNLPKNCQANYVASIFTMGTKMAAKKIETTFESEHEKTKKTKTATNKLKAIKGFVASTEHELISVEAYYLAEKEDLRRVAKFKIG